ncbi:MAG: hypothetical protein GXP31_17805 [Kiritimatiellaeota bacterium]|nr:hypothetical protein [Kiritimatiellota bacterium]
MRSLGIAAVVSTLTAICLTFAAVTFTAAAAVTVAADDRAVRVENGLIGISVSPDTPSLLSVRIGAQRFVQESAPLYELLLVKKDGGTLLLTSEDATDSSVAVERGEGFAVLVIKNRVHGGRKIEVTCRIRVSDANSLTRWRIRAKNETDLSLRSVAYPIVATPLVLGQSVDDDFLVWPQSDEAEWFPAPGKNFKVGQGFGRHNGALYPGGASLQMMTFGDADGSLYFATYDAAGNVKRFRFKKTRQNFRFSIEHFVPESPGNDFDAPYDTILGGFKGDWRVAGDIYRKWAWKQQWCKTKWCDRIDVPQWLKKWPPVVYAGALGEMNRKRPLDLLPQVTRDYMNVFGRDIVMFFHGWEKNRAQLGYPRPDPFPPDGGETYFRSAMERVRALGSRPFVFVCGPYWVLQERGCGYDDRAGFDQFALPYAALDPNGNTQRLFLAGSLDMAKMCPATEFWKRCVVKKLVQCVKLGVPMVQIDSFPCCQVYPCYNSAHGHPLGYGKWFYRAFADILGACRAKAVKIDRSFAMPTEGTCELFIPLTDSYMSRMHMMPRWHHDAFGAMKVPLFTYVYHEYLPPYGAVGPYLTAWKETSTYFTRGVALNLLWGRLPTVRIGGNQQPLESAGLNQRLLGFLKRAVAASSTYAYDYVVRGRMLHPPMIQAPNISVKYWRWWTKPPSNAVFESPAVLAETWRAPSGSTAMIFVNISEQTATFAVRLPDPDLTVNLYRNGVRKQIAVEGRTVRMKMQAMEIAMIEF